MTQGSNTRQPLADESDINYAMNFDEVSKSVASDSYNAVYIFTSIVDENKVLAVNKNLSRNTFMNALWFKA